MAANFWDSTHRKLLVRQEDVQNSHFKDRARGLTHKQLQQMTVYFVKYMQHLVRATNGVLRQRVAATAAVYFQRFYLRNDFCVWDPRHVAPACVYLSSKTEESPLQAKFLLQYIRSLSNRYSHPSTQFDMRALLDLELVLLEELGFNLVLFSPYDSLAQLANDAGHPTLLAAAWGVVNDAHCTPLVLCHPPHILSVASLVTAAALRDVDVQQWLSQLDVDLGAVSNVSCQLLQWCQTGLFQPISPVTVAGLMDLMAMTPSTPSEDAGTPGATPPGNNGTPAPP